MRIAWIGPTPTPHGGVAGVAWQLLSGLGALGYQIDAYIASGPRELPGALFDLPHTHIVLGDPHWQWDRWYSRNQTAAFVTGLTARAAAQHRLARQLITVHRHHPYDIVYQFSGIELIGLKHALSELAPLILHPETHIAGELAGWRSERETVRQCEPAYRRLAIPALLAARVGRQRRDINLVPKVICISSAFARSLQREYGVHADRCVVIPNPVDLHYFRPSARTPGSHPLRLLYVGRISTRKGVRQLVDLSHRLSDLLGQVELRLVGGHTLWSDYRPLLRSLNLEIASYLGPVSSDEVRSEMDTADILVQPSTFEPFGLTAAEGLAMGLPVVSSDAVGATESASAACSWRYPAADSDALEATVRQAVAAMSSPAAGEIRAAARSEAERLFSPAGVARAVSDVLELTVTAQ